MKQEEPGLEEVQEQRGDAGGAPATLVVVTPFLFATVTPLPVVLLIVEELCLGCPLA